MCRFISINNDDNQHNLAAGLRLMEVGRRAMAEIVANNLDAGDYSFDKTTSIDKDIIVFKGRHR